MNQDTALKLDWGAQLVVDMQNINYHLHHLINILSCAPYYVKQKNKNNIISSGLIMNSFINIILLVEC